MSRFKRIKNKSNKKSSVSIDEKIAALNKELGKTGMLSEITNSTDGVYSTSTYVPPQEYIEADVPDSSGILGGGFTQSSAGSGTEGDAPTFSSVSDLFNDTVNATIFPSTEYEGTQGYGIVIGPSFGAGTTYGIIEGGNTYRAILGGHLAGGTRGAAHYKQELENKISAGRPQEEIDDAEEHYQLAVQVEAALIKIGFDHTLFNVTWKAWRRAILFEDLSGSPSYNHPTKGTLYLTGFSMLGTRNRYAEQNARRETTTNPIRRGLEDEPIYPGPIESLFNLGKRAFDWLKEQARKARKRGEEIKKKRGGGKPNRPGSGFPDPIPEPDPTKPEPDVTGDDGTTFGPNKGQPKKEPKYKTNRKKNRPDVEGGISPQDIKSGLDYLKYTLKFYGSVPTAANNMLYHNNVQNPDHPDHRKHDPSSPNYEGPKEVDFNPIERAQTDKMIEEIINGLNGGKGPKDPNKLSLDEIKELSDGMNAKYKENQTWYNTFHSLPTHNGADGEPISKVTKNEFGGWDVESNYIFTDDQDASDPFSNAFAKTPFWTPRKATVNSAKKNKNAEGGEPFFNKATGEQTGKQFNTQQVYRGRKPLSSKKNLFTSDSFTTESYITEGVGLGLYEPEAMNVDLADIRKGIMPEYPKKPPAKMIDGYHQDSKLKPKEFKDKYLLKIDEKQLIRNHRLKKGEADEMINTIKMINDHLKKHPEDLIHAQMRYPIDDPRLAELNWKMDQMLEAGEEYLDKNFKENQTLYKRATDRTKKNIKLTDPEYVQQKYDELRGTPKLKRSINKRNVSRFFKKPVNKKSSMEEIDDKIKQLDKDLLL